MSARSKSTVLGVALVALTLWPLVHIGLVRRYGLSPWKLAGWGMYSAPRSRSLGMEVFGRPAGGGPLVHLTNPPPAVRDAAGPYLERHRWLHRLARPHALAAAIAAAEPGWDDVTIAVFEPELDRASGMVVMRALVHHFTVTAAGAEYGGEVDPWSAGLPPALVQQLGPRH